jgi:hypothetical protein
MGQVFICRKIKARFRSVTSESIVRRIPLAVFLTFAITSPAWSQAAQKTAPTPHKHLTVEQLWTLDATYTDPKHGVTFRYPSVWAAGTGFAYHQPLLTTSRDADIIATYGYDARNPPPDGPSSPYVGSDLEGFGFTYATAAGANQAQCETMAEPVADSKTHTSVLIGMRRFSSYEVGEGGMSQSTGGDLYVTFAESTCYFFETDSGWIARGVFEDVKSLSNRDSALIFAHLWEIMKTVRISPSGRGQ